MENSIYFQEKNFSKYLNKDIYYGFFTKNGGISKRNFCSLNCCFKGGDLKTNVNSNRKIVCDKMGFKASDLITLNQVHSTNIIEISKNNLKKENLADGMISSEKNILLGVLTADCAPLIFSGKESIAILHVGWKGLLNGIIDNLIEKFSKKNENIFDLSCVIGPHLKMESFHVTQDFVDNLMMYNPVLQKFVRNNNNVLKFDFTNCIVHNLKRLGMSKISIIEKDTYTNPKLLFSYRFYKNSGKECGRQISVIGKR